MSASQDSVKVAAAIATIWTTKTLPALYALAGNVAQSAVNDMKKNRPWNDQTFSAKDQLFGKPFLDPGKSVGFFVAHGVQYGVYLELTNDRKNEVLRPTIEVFGAKYLVGVRRIVGDKSGSS